MLSREDIYHFIFVEEAKEQVEFLEDSSLLLQENSEDETLINALFRAAHSLKGAASTLNFNSIIGLSHRLESIFDLKRSKGICFTEMIVDQILIIIDALKDIIQNIYNVEIEKVPEDVISIYEDIDGYLELAEPTVQEKKVSHLLTLVIKVHDDAEMLCVKAYMIVEALKDVIDIKGVIPENYEEADDSVFGHELIIEIDQEYDLKMIEAALESITDIDEVYFKQPEEVEEKEPDMVVDVETLKVSVGKVDSMLSFAESFVLLQDRFENHYTKLKHLDLPQSYTSEYSILLEQFSDLVKDYQDLSIDIRLVPLNILFKQFPRLIRTLSRDIGKDIDLVVSGGNLGVDKGLIEKLTDPLNHLVRNAVDHGIETTSDRIKQGKPAKGQLQLKAVQGQHMMTIILEDDGAGLDVKKIQSKAFKNGLVTLDEAAYYREEDWLDLIFSSGFSTKDVVSEISGRGVGLDVVKNTIRSLNGNISIETKAGLGTKFIINIPLTLSIMNLLIVRQGESYFGIPSSLMKDIIREESEHISFYDTGFEKMYEYEEEHFKYLHLKDQYKLETRKDKMKWSYILLTNMNEMRFAVECDEIIGEKMMVIKPVDHLTRPGRMLADRSDLLGLSILGDGRLVQIVDVSKWL